MKNGKKLLLLSALLLVACGGGETTPSVSDTPSSNDSVSVENSSEVSSEQSSEFASSEESSETPVIQYSTVTDVLNVSNGYFDSEKFSGINKGDEFVVGETISATLTLSYFVDEEAAQRYIVQVNDTLYRPSSVNSTEDESVLNFSVVVPAENMQVFLVINDVLSTSEDGYTVTLVDSPYAKVVGYDSTLKYNSSFRAILWWDPGFAPESLKYRVVGTEEWIKLNTFFYSTSTTLTGLDLSTINANIELKLFGEYVGCYNINYINADKVSPGQWADPFPTVSQPGKKVEFNIEPLGDYYPSTEPTIEGIDFETATITSSRVSFTMPENDVTIEFHVDEKPTITFAETNNYVSAKVYDGNNPTYANEISCAAPGEDVYVFVDAVDGQAFTGIKVNGGETIATQTNYTGTLIFCTFEMPADGSDVVITVVTADAVKLNLEFGEGGELSTNASSYVPGTEVRIDVTPDDNFHAIDTINVKDHDDIVLTYNEDYGDVYYTFTMPEEEITIVATFKELPSTDVTFVADCDTISYVSARGYDSNVYLQLDNTSTLLTGEQIDVYVEMTNQSKVPSKIVFTDANGNVISTYDYGKDQWGYGTFGDVYVPEGYDSVTLTIEFVSQEPLNYTINDNDNEGYELLFKTGGYNEPFVEELGTVYPGTQFQMQISGDAGEGYEYIVYLTDTDGNRIEGKYGSYTVETDFVINVEKVKNVGITITGVEDIGMNPEYFGLSDSDYNSYGDGDIVAAGKTLRGYLYSSSEFKVELVVGDAVVNTYTSEFVAEEQNYGVDLEFVVPNDDFTLKVSPVESPDDSKTYENFSIDASTLTLGDYTEDSQVGNFTLNATTDKILTVDPNNYTFQGTKYTQRIKTNGTSTSDERSIEFTLEAGATIKIVALSGNNDTDRQIDLYDCETGEVIDSATVYGKNTVDGATKHQEYIVFTVEEAGTYAVGSANSGVNFYAIYIEYNA